MADHSMGTSPGKKLMIVDDHVLFREGLASLVHSTPDFDVVGSAGSVYEAIQMARELRPEVILMDYAMPDGTGIDATRVILTELPGCKIIFLTMHESDDKLFEAIRAGAIGFLFKNVRSSELVETLRGVTRGEVGIRGDIARRVMAEFARLSPDHVVDEPLLTVREIEVLRELAQGATNQEIARRLVISENTVKNHIRNVLFKLKLHSRRDAGDYARRHGLLSQRRLADLPTNDADRFQPGPEG